jgi:uncharacterized repeat protein (TIGR03803 family)
MKSQKYKTIKNVFHTLAVVWLLGSSMLAEAVPTTSLLAGLGGFQAGPLGYLAQGRDGSLYGTNLTQSTGGTAFKVSLTGVVTQLHTFNRLIEGVYPSPLTLGVDGNFYGLTSLGGKNNKGTIYKMTPTGVVTVLYNIGTVANDGNFTNAQLGGFVPLPAPVQASDGNLYGVISAGGIGGLLQGRGVLYHLVPATKTYTILHDFKNANPKDGRGPQAQLLVGKDGNLYGTTTGGGASASLGGVVFRYRLISKSPTDLLTSPYSILHNFNSLTDGGYLASNPLIQAVDGNFYGTTTGYGQATTQGNVFRLSPTGTYTNLHSFSRITAPASGHTPVSGVVQGSDGNFYGATSQGGKPAGKPSGDAGVLFKITPQGAYTVLHAFDRLAEGSFPRGLTAHTNGKIYVATAAGNHVVPQTFGGIFKLDVGAKPFVSALPSVGRLGNTVGLFGDFTDASSVSFNGVNGISSGASTTFRTAIVPAGPATGLVKINKPVNPISGFKPFSVLPSLTSISPTSGKVNTSVVLRGLSLSQTTAVFFNGKSAVFTVNNDSQLTAKVPVGATTGRVVVVTKGGDTAGVINPNFTVKP